MSYDLTSAPVPYLRYIQPKMPEHTQQIIALAQEFTVVL